MISTVQQADGTIGYADASQAGDLGTVAVKVGDDYVPFSAEAAAEVVDASPLDDSAKGDNRVVVKLDHNTTEKGAYPIVLVSYDVACPAYKDANTAKFVKSWLTYVTSDEGQQTAASAARLRSDVQHPASEGRQVHRRHQNQVSPSQWGDRFR